MIKLFTLSQKTWCFQSNLGLSFKDDDVDVAVVVQCSRDSINYYIDIQQDNFFYLLL